MDDSGDHTAIMNGVAFHYYSFTIDGYRRLLADNGLRLVSYHHHKNGNGCYLAAKGE